MKKLSLIATATLLFGVTATAAQSTQATTGMSEVSGYTTLIALSNVKGIKPVPTVASLQALKANTAAYKSLGEKLHLSPATFGNLLGYGNKPVPNALVSQAISEAAVNPSDVLALFNRIGQIVAAAGGTIDRTTLVTLLTDPTIVALVNKIANDAQTPVTGRGNGT